MDAGPDNRGTKEALPADGATDKDTGSHDKQHAEPVPQLFAHYRA